MREGLPVLTSAGVLDLFRVNRRVVLLAQNSLSFSVCMGTAIVQEALVYGPSVCNTAHCELDVHNCRGKIWSTFWNGISTVKGSSLVGRMK